MPHNPLIFQKSQKINTVHRLTIGKLSSMAGTAGRALQQATVDLPQVVREPRTASSQPQPPAALPVEVIEPAPSAFHLAWQVLSPVVRPLETAFIVFIVTIFILLQRDDLRDRAIRLFGSGDLHRTTTAMDDAARRLSRYFLSQFAVNAGVGVAIGTGLFLIGIPSPVLWGMLAALLRLVPYVGIWIVAVLATALAAAVSPEWSIAIWSLALFVIVELLAGQVIEPMLYGHSTGISPFSVVVAAIFWSWIWGPVGLILSTPLTLCLSSAGMPGDSKSSTCCWVTSRRSRQLRTFTSERWPAIRMRYSNKSKFCCATGHSPRITMRSPSRDCSLRPATCCAAW